MNPIPLPSLPASPETQVRQWTRIDIPARLEAVQSAVDLFSDALVRDGATGETLAALTLAIVEALTNAVKYGRATPDQIAIELAWTRVDDEIEITISEPGFFRPASDWANMPADPLRESGRGGFLIASSTDSFQHENRDGRHVLRLRKHLGETAPAQTRQADHTLDAMAQELAVTYESLAALYRLAEILATTGDFEAFLSATLVKLRDLVELDAASVRMRGPSGVLRTIAGIPRPPLREIAQAIEADVFRSGHERTITSTATLAADDPLRAHNGCAFCCPISFQSTRTGVLTIERHHDIGYFNAGQLSVMRTVADFIGIAHATSQLQEQRRAHERTLQELDIARQIQDTLIPRVFPRRRDWNIHGICRSAAAIGGDYFGVHEISGQGVLLVIADVMGKGVPAALVATIFHTAVQARLEVGSLPGALLSEINQQLTLDLSRMGVFITAQALFLPERGATFRHAHAGHCPFVLATAGGPPKAISFGQLPLGIDAGESYPSHESPFTLGTRIVMVTDGITETEDLRGRQLGIEGVIAALPRDADDGPDRLCLRLLEFAERHSSGRPPSDDRTVLIAERIGER